MLHCAILTYKLTVKELKCIYFVLKDLRDLCHSIFQWVTSLLLFTEHNITKLSALMHSVGWTLYIMRLTGRSLRSRWSSS